MYSPYYINLLRDFASRTFYFPGFYTAFAYSKTVIEVCTSMILLYLIDISLYLTQIVILSVDPLNHSNLFFVIK